MTLPSPWLHHGPYILAGYAIGLLLLTPLVWKNVLRLKRAKERLYLLQAQNHQAEQQQSDNAPLPSSSSSALSQMSSRASRL